MGIEIEKKFTVKELPADLEKYPFHEIEQGYLNVHPAIRVRREDDIFYMTYKGKPGHEEVQVDGKIGQVEYNMPLDAESYENLAKKAEGIVIRKRRYLIPINEDAFDKEYLQKDEVLRKAVESGDIKIELDVFKGEYDGLKMAEVEFPSEEAASKYHPAAWFEKDVTGDRRYSNSQMSRGIDTTLTKNSG